MNSRFRIPIKFDEAAENNRVYDTVKEWVSTMCTVKKWELKVQEGGEIALSCPCVTWKLSWLGEDAHAVQSKHRHFVYAALCGECWHERTGTGQSTSRPPDWNSLNQMKLLKQSLHITLYMIRKKRQKKQTKQQDKAGNNRGWKDQICRVFMSAAVRAPNKCWLPVCVNTCTVFVCIYWG